MRVIFVWQTFAGRLAGLALALIVCAGLLASCATTSDPPASASAGEGVFKFTVMLYKEPVEVTSWKYDVAQSANPEGAALNIITAMQHGDWDNWQASWESAEQPKLNPVDRAAVLERWQRLKGEQVFVVGRVIAGVDLVEELSIRNPQTKSEEKMLLPLKRSNDQWWLTAMDPNSEFLNWETSSNKIVAYRENFSLLNYLSDVKKRQH